MDAEPLRQLAKFDTFRPFRLYLKDGRTYDLVQSGLLLVFPSYVIIGITGAGETKPIADELVWVDVDIIDRAELLTLRARPFRPFRFYVLESTIFEVRPPEHAVVDRFTLVLFHPTQINSHEEIEIALLHITRVEPISIGPQPASNRN